MRREAPRCNSPDRQVGVNRRQHEQEARGADIIHAGPSNLAVYPYLYHDLTVVAISLRPFGPDGLQPGDLRKGEIRAPIEPSCYVSWFAQLF